MLLGTLALLLGLALFVWAVLGGATTFHELHHFYLGWLLWLVGLGLYLLLDVEWVGLIGGLIAFDDGAHHAFARAYVEWGWLQRFVAWADHVFGKARAP